MKLLISTGSGFTAYLVPFVISFFSITVGLKAQNTWPTAFANQVSSFNAGGVLMNNDRLFSLEGDQFAWRGFFTNRKGVTERQVHIGNGSLYLGFFNGTANVVSDTAHHRLFIAGLSENNASIVKGFFGTSNLNEPIARLHSIICLDTAGSQLWSVRLLGPTDTIAKITALIADGEGGVYVSGRFAGSMAQTQLRLSIYAYSLRLDGGCSFFSRISKTGVVLWTKIQKDYAPLSSPLRALGVQFVWMPKANQVEFISTYADTAIKAVNGSYEGTPSVYLLEKSRFNANGTLLSQKRGKFTCDYFPGNTVSPSFLQQIKVNGQPRLLIAADERIKLDRYFSAALLFDTAFNFLSGIEIPGLCFDGSNIALKENILGWLKCDYIRISPDPEGERIRYTFMQIDLRTGLAISALKAENKCRFEYQNYARPTLLAYADENSPSNSLMYLKTGGIRYGRRNTTTSIYRFKNSEETPCAIFSAIPVPVLKPVPITPSLTWTNGGQPWTNRPNFYWKDTSFSIIKIGGRTRVQNFCDARSSGLMQKEMVVCGDSLLLRAPLFYYDETRLNGVVLNNDTVEIRQSGPYIFSYRDTCNTTQPISDTIQIRFVNKVSLSISPDVLQLCPTEAWSAGIIPQAGVAYKWSGNFPLTNSGDPLRTFSASELPIGFSKVFLEASLQNDCKVTDTLSINNLAGPQLPLLPDTLKLCPQESKTINARAVSGIQYAWISPFLLNDSTRLNNVFSASQLPISTFSLQLILKDNGPCSAVANMVLQNSNGPILKLEIDSITLCAQEQKTLGVLQEPNIQYLWEPNNLLQNASLAKPKFEAIKLPPGLQVFTVSASANGKCSAQKTLKVWNRSPLLSEIVEVMGDSVLALQPAGYSNLEWQLNGGSFKGNTTGNQISILWTNYFAGQQVQASFTDDFGCKGLSVYQRIPARDSIFPPYIFPNLVTLNGDNKNDRFEILNVQANDIIELKICNRWGKEIYSNLQYKNDFPAERKIENGTYFYSVRALMLRQNKLEEKVFRGWIEVIKD